MKQQTKGGALHRLWQALPWLWMAAAYLFDLWYQLVPGKWIVDSDLASEMILSDLLNKEGSIISHNWFYSTELKVVNLQWFYRLGLLLFPDDWHLARAFGMAVTLALYAACMLFFVKCARLGRPGLWMVGTLLWPFGQHYLVYAIYGGYYLVYTFFYMLVLALVLPSLCTALYTTGPDVLRISAAPSTPPPTPASAHTSTSATAASVFLVPGRFFFGCWSDGSGPPIEGSGDGCVYCGCA